MSTLVDISMPQIDCYSGIFNCYNLEANLSNCFFITFLVLRRLMEFQCPLIHSLMHYNLGSELSHWVWDKMVTILQTIFSNKFSEWRYFIFRNFTEVCSQGPNIGSLGQHWFKYWLGTKQETGSYLNQWWSMQLTCIYIIIWPQIVKTL